MVEIEVRFGHNFNILPNFRNLDPHYIEMGKDLLEGMILQPGFATIRTLLTGKRLKVVCQ
ncbi:hypothetical protein GCM10027299_35160 [Larkinella ripae]